MFKVGNVVKWKSQAGGHSKEKSGEVVLVVPAGRRPIEVMTDEMKRENLPTRYDGWPRDHESYVVKVKGGKTDKALPVLYWPRAKALELA